MLIIILAWMVANIAMGRKAKKYNHRRAFWTYVRDKYTSPYSIVVFALFWPCCLYDAFINEERKFLE
ncbi:MAG: hypothetical protein J6M60_01160 [Clostridia bacterium]|nr:hypothetical protein [Clostridia bacterium]